MNLSRLVDYFLPWFLPLALMGVWFVGSRSGWIPPQELPAPGAVVRSAIALTKSGELPHHLGTSAKRAVVGLAIGGGIGFLLALANGLSKWSRNFSDSSVQMLRTIPHLALIPLVIIWFGIGEEAKRFLIVTGVLFPIYINTFHGIRSLDPKLIEMGRVYGFGPWALFSQIIFPGALPSILVGLRYALGLMWLTLIVAETVATDSGIGYMTMNAREFLQTDVVVLGILLYALLGKLADGTVVLLERWFLRWNPSYRHA
ncbi:MAG TPA: ABC transporter permease subunit [Chthoniobacterales bacterium]